VAEQVADFVLKRLRQWGIEQVYAYPGDGINGLVAAFGRAGDQPQFIQTRHEEMAAFAAKALLGKDVLSDELPYVTGSIGLLGTRPSYELMRDCDTLLIVGSNFPYSQFLPKYGAARAIQIDIEGSAIGMRYPTELNIVADAASTLDRLIPLLQKKHDQ
jgi:pyruvate dehydrogenase (quinone)